MAVTSMGQSGMRNPARYNRMNATPAPISATGGTVTTETVGSRTFKKHTFNSSGTFTITSDASVECLVVAGGGGGGTSGGGGGAGGYFTSGVAVPAGAHVVTVGAGGAQNANGSDSSFGSILSATGGGKGGAGDGGSGGGANSGATNFGDGNTPAISATGSAYGSTTQGQNGGTSTNAVEYVRWAGGGGGGGGASTVGLKGNGYASTGQQTGGDGGDGLYFPSTGSDAYAGGGGGRAYTSSNHGDGGIGGGGDAPSTPGTANTGGGGGGTASGGSGVVIIRYEVI